MDAHGRSLALIFKDLGRQDAHSRSWALIRFATMLATIALFGWGGTGPPRWADYQGLEAYRRGGTTVNDPYLSVTISTRWGRDVPGII